MTIPTHYHLKLSDEERGQIELWSFNHYHAFGRNMRIPPRLYEDLKNKGVRMKYLSADASLEDHGNAELILANAKLLKEDGQ